MSILRCYFVVGFTVYLCHFTVNVFFSSAKTLAELKDGFCFKIFNKLGYSQVQQDCQSLAKTFSNSKMCIVIGEYVDFETCHEFAEIPTIKKSTKSLPLTTTTFKKESTVTKVQLWLTESITTEFGTTLLTTTTMTTFQGNPSTVGNKLSDKLISKRYKHFNLYFYIYKLKQFSPFSFSPLLFF